MIVFLYWVILFKIREKIEINLIALYYNLVRFILDVDRDAINKYYIR